MPSSNVEYWTEKFTRNVKRDQEILAAYAELGLTPLVVWECETHDLEGMKRKLERYLAAIE